MSIVGNKFDIICNTLDNGIILINKNLEVKFWNRWLEIRTGISSSNIVDNKLTDFYSNIDENDKLSKNMSIGFSQSIYESGGIELSIQYAKDKYNYDLLSWENINNQILQAVYETLLEISILNLQIEQSEYKLQNKVYPSQEEFKKEALKVLQDVYNEIRLEVLPSLNSKK